MPKTLPFSNSKLTFEVDNEDYSRCIYKGNWHLRNSGTGFTIQSCERPHISLAQFILKTNELVDHKDRNIFNNKKENIRLATRGQNMANREKLQASSSSSKYIGVSKFEPTNSWHARICVNKKRIHLGYFETEIEAAEAYNKAAIRYRGEFANLNSISK